MQKPDIQYYKNGQIYAERYFLNDKFHKTNGPALVSYYENGQIKLAEYWIEGKRHNPNGPAYIQFCERDQINLEYYINGRLQSVVHVVLND